ncbi:MAG: HlyC/CorC family transporter [Acidobacteria bacterium]|nr:HlyC/CorC family transporter [Acidobacteriota bacterium]
MEIELLFAGILLIMLVFLSTVDIAFSHLSDVGLRRLSFDEDSADHNKAAVFLREVLENRSQFRFLISSANQVVLMAFAILITHILIRVTERETLIFAAAIAAVLLVAIVFRQIVPRMILRSSPEKRIVMLIPIVRPLYSFLSLFVRPFISYQSSRETRLDTTTTPDTFDERDDENNSDDLQALIEVGEAEGIIEKEERVMIETMVEFSETRAGEIMTPRTEIVAVPIGTLIKDARDMMIEERVSRLPVYGGSIDNIEGILYVRDLLAALATGRKEHTVETIMRDAYLVPETKTASELLKSMQREHVQIAVVIDEYGGVAGLITVEDLIEEIVGEIEDEDIEQDEVVEIRELDNGCYDVLGSTEIERVEELFDLELEGDDYTTIAGLVVTEAGYVPKVGERLSVKGLDVEILEADEKRLTLLRLCHSSPEDEGSAGG